MKKLRPVDLEIALERYRRLTGDTHAVLRRVNEDGEPAFEQVAFYSVEGSRFLGKMLAHGVKNAHAQLTMFCDGYEAAQRYIEDKDVKPLEERLDIIKRGRG